MKPLSQAVNAISSSAIQSSNELNTQQPGSTNTDGKTNTQLQVQPRGKPLTESQITQIVSAVLQTMPEISFERVPVFEQRVVTNDGHSVLMDVKVSEEKEFHVKFEIKKNVNPSFIKSALRLSPEEACVSHLHRLAMHKRLGNNDQERTVLIFDYAAALRPYSDFVVHLACKSFWDESDSPFYPKIKSLVTICEQIHSKLHHAILPPPAPRQKIPPRQRHEDSPTGKSERRIICDVFIANGAEDPFDSINSNYQLERLAIVKYGWKKPEGMI